MIKMHLGSQSSIVDLARQGNLSGLQRYIENCRRNENDDNDEIVPLDKVVGSDALYAASSAGQLEIIEYLVENKIGNVNSAQQERKLDNSRNSCSRGDNDSSGTMKTPLSIAIEKGYLDIVRYLVEKGNAEIIGEASRTKGDSSLFLACRYGQLEVIRYLVEKSRGRRAVDVNAIGNVQTRSTPLIEAAYRGHGDVVVYLAKERKASTKKCDYRGRSALHAAIENKHFHVVTLLVLKCGAKVNVYDQSNITPLQLACETGSLSMVKFLHEKGASIHRPGWSLLEAAIRLKHREMLEYLVDKPGVKINAKGGYQLTPLYLACTHGNKEILEILLRRGADINSRSSITSLQALHCACKGGKLKLVKCLCEHGADVAAHAGDSGCTPLHMAVSGGHLAVVQYLLEQRGADANATNYKGNTVLHDAVCDGQIQIVKYLIKMGAVDVNAPTSPMHPGMQNGPIIFAPGSTPLHHACIASYRGNHDILEYLISCGANLKARNDDGGTPLGIAFAHGWRNAAISLLDAGGIELLHIVKWRGDSGNGSPDYDPLLTDYDNLYPFPVRPSKKIFPCLVQRRPLIIHMLSKESLGRMLEKEGPELLMQVTCPKTRNLPLHDACMYGSRRGVIEYMIEKCPAALRQWNVRGRLPFHEACDSSGSNNKDNKTGSSVLCVVSTMLQCQPSALVDRDRHGRLPFEIAIANKNTPLDVIFLLLRGLPTSLKEVIIK